MIIRSLNLLYPPFRDLVEHGLKLARLTGLQVHVFESYRTFDRQEDLYAQGRTTEGRVVTRARPGESWHNYGLAVDLVFDGSAASGIQWSWDGDHVGDRAGDYARLGAIMTSTGINWLGAAGSSFFETPHFEKNWGLSLPIARELHRVGGLPAVWIELDKYLGG